MSYNFLLNQDKPEELCKDRDIKTREIFVNNDFYGHASILKKYAGVSNNYSLKCILEHGVAIEENIDGGELTQKLPLYLSISSERAALFRSITLKPSISIGFGFLYAVKLFHEQYGGHIEKSERKGTIVFPTHSTHRIIAKFDFTEYVKSLKELPDEFKPIVICIYWKDFLCNNHIEYLKANFQVITAGHMFDPLFFLRLYDICRQFKYATSNDVGTHVFASVKSGCSFFFNGVRESGNIDYEVLDQAILAPLSDRSKNQVMLLFDKPLETISLEQKNFVDKHLGTNYFRSRKSLKLIFIYAELCDKFQWNISKKYKSIDKLPTYYARQKTIEKMRDSLKSYLKFIVKVTTRVKRMFEKG